ncbi:MAG: orotate phosphoribosyltransferase [Pseudomonadales bacterium]|nr:orotate phosphoribosyltransferase [Pseudomonadales bacterium]
MKPYQKEFIEFALDQGVLKFGQFTLKSGRISPYFFNAGLFNSGVALSKLGEFYAAAIIEKVPPFDILFGPAYKGIPIATATAIALATQYQKDISYAFNRKEKKKHGEGGEIVGADLAGDVLIIDDVITAGTAIREVMDIFTRYPAKPVAVIVALDRQEKGKTDLSAIQEVEKDFNIPVFSIVNLDQLILFLSDNVKYTEELARVSQYRQQFGCSAGLNAIK